MQHYLQLATLLRKLFYSPMNLKPTLYSTPNLLMPLSSALSLLSLILRNKKLFLGAIADMSKETDQPIRNRELMCIMVAEWINVGRIKGGGKLRRIIESSRVVSLLKEQVKGKKMIKELRQIRIRNAAMAQIVNHSQQASINQNTSDLNANQIVIPSGAQPDTLLPDVYHLSPACYSQFMRESPLAPSFVIQSFSSLLPAWLLLHGCHKLQKPYRIVDACAAPGNKTLQLCDYGFPSKVYAFERDQKRFQLLKSRMDFYSAQNVKLRRADFLSVDSKQLGKVKFVLVDASCSSSGNLNTELCKLPEEGDGERQGFEEFCRSSYEALSTIQKHKIDKIRLLQISLLDKAAQMNPRRLCYSTCSIFHRENEDVIVQFLAKHPNFAIKDCRFARRHPSLHSGFGECEGCLRVDPRDRFSDGFFVCVLKRL